MVWLRIPGWARLLLLVCTLFLATMIADTLLRWKPGQGEAAGTTYRYCGSSKSDVYHYPSCSYVGQIKPENLIWFVDAADAQSRGYRPCSRCKPPTAQQEAAEPLVIPVLFGIGLLATKHAARAR